MKCRCKSSPYHSQTNTFLYFIAHKKPSLYIYFDLTWPTQKELTCAPFSSVPFSVNHEFTVIFIYKQLLRLLLTLSGIRKAINFGSGGVTQYELMDVIMVMNRFIACCCYSTYFVRCKHTLYSNLDCSLCINF